MTETAPPAIPSLGRLFGAALGHWSAHQSRFWKFTLPTAFFLAVLPYVMLRAWIPEVSPWVQSGIRAFVDVLILYQWFKYALYDDWSVRRGRLLQQRKFPWGAFLSGGFVAFWALHFALSYGLLSTWRQFALVTGTPMSWAVQVSIVPLKELVLALAFGGFMLFLPAKAAALPWSPGDAFRRAAGIRGRLILVTVLWALLSLALLRIVDTLAWYLAANVLSVSPTEHAIIVIDFTSGMVGIATDFLCYYVLAFIVARLFIARTGWTPEPLPR